MLLLFTQQASNIVRDDPGMVGLAVGGSWITKEMDAYSDLDLVLVTGEKIAPKREKMLEIASRFGKLLSGFTGEHVGEPRLLICLFDEPLLHVDIKFLTEEEFATRVETPVILVDKDSRLQSILSSSASTFPAPDYQWIEDRFWTWVHYSLLKIGRGEYMEAFDFFSFLRMTVLGPLTHIRNGNLPRGVRRVETQLGEDDLLALKSTLPSYDRKSLIDALDNSIALYRSLRNELYGEEVMLQGKTESRVMDYLEEVRNPA